MPDLRQRHPSTARNRGPILEVLRRVLPPQAYVVEIASGTGEHAKFFASNLPGVTWQPTELTDDNIASIEAWRTHEDTPNLRPPKRLDVTTDDWGVGRCEAIFNANMVHICSWEVSVALMRGAGRHLRPGGLLVTYGPYRIGGEHTAPSNAEFDASLRARDPSWGVRDLEALAEQAAVHDLTLHDRFEMPANNFTLVFRKSTG